jgi:hypothetical protein
MAVTAGRRLVKEGLGCLRWGVGLAVLNAGYIVESEGFSRGRGDNREEMRKPI